MLGTVGPRRWRHVVAGIVIGGTIGAIAGVRHGIRVDRACGGDNHCSGPPISGLTYGIEFGAVGMAGGGIVGWFWP